MTKERKLANVTAAAVPDPEEGEVSCRLSLDCFALHFCTELHCAGLLYWALLSPAMFLLALLCTTLHCSALRAAGLTVEVTQVKGTGSDLQMRMSKSGSSLESLSLSDLQVVEQCSARWYRVVQGTILQDKHNFLQGNRQGESFRCDTCM